MSNLSHFLTYLLLLFANRISQKKCNDCCRSGKDQLADKPGGLRTLLLEEEQNENGGTTTSLQAWDTFVQETLHSILDHQMVGSYTNLANLSTVSQVITNDLASIFPTNNRHNLTALFNPFSVPLRTTRSSSAWI